MGLIRRMHLRGPVAGFSLHLEAARCIGRRDYAGAVENYSKIAERYGESAYVLLMMAQCREWAGEHEGTLQMAERVLQLDPNDFHALQIVARIQVSNGQHRVSRDYVIRALENMPEPFSDRYIIVYWLVNALRVLPKFRRIDKRELEGLKDMNRDRRQWVQWAHDYLVWYRREYQAK